MISLSWDAFITLFFVFAAVYGFVLPRSRIAVILVSTYVALTITNVGSEALYKFLIAKSGLVGNWAANASTFTVSVGLFIFLIILISVRGGLSADEERGGLYTPFIMALLGFLVAGLILSSLMSFMPEETRIHLLDTSKFAILVWKYHLLWIVVPPLVLVSTSVFRRSLRT